MFIELKKLGNLSISYTIGNVVDRGLKFLLIPLYVHYLSAADYGTLGLLTAMSVLLTMALAFSGRSIIMRFYYQFDDEIQRREFLGLFWIFLVLVSGLIVFGLYFWGQPLSKLLWSQLPFDPFVRIVLISIYLDNAFYIPLLSLYRAREQAKRYAFFSILKAVLTTGLISFLVVVGRAGVFGILKAQLLGTFIFAVITGTLFLKEITFSWNWRLLSPAFLFAAPLLFHYLSQWILSFSDRSILDRYVSLEIIGLYTLAYQVGNIFQVMVVSVNNALMPTFSRAANSFEDKTLLKRLITYYLLGVTMSGVLFALVTPTVIILITPLEYHAAGNLIPWFLLSVIVFGYYYVPMNLLSFTAGETKFIPLVTVIAGMVNIGLNLFLIPRFGIMAAAVNTAVGYAVLAGLMTLQAHRAGILNIETRRVIKIFIVALIIYGAAQILMQFQLLINLTISVLAVGSFPLLLWVLGFWSDNELMKFCSVYTNVIKRIVRT